MQLSGKYYKLLKHGTRNAEHGTRNTERGTRNTERGTRNAEHGTRNQPTQNSLYVVFTTLNSERRLI